MYLCVFSKLGKNKGTMKNTMKRKATEDGKVNILI